MGNWGIKMDGNVLIVVLDVLFCVVPLALVGVGTLVYDHLQRHRTRVGIITGAGVAALFFHQKMLQLAVLKATGMACTLIAADVVVL
jgi:hypothetical protein